MKDDPDNHHNRDAFAARCNARINGGGPGPFRGCHGNAAGADLTILEEGTEFLNRALAAVRRHLKPSGMFWLDIFQQVRDGPGAHGREDVFILVVRGDHDDLRFRADFANLAGRGDAVHLTGHFEIHQDHIRLVLRHGGNRSCA